tara:strand:- start:54 stop:1022 length:969 start_codon:yes stop_codon:yes gene_type:complete
MELINYLVLQTEIFQQNLVAQVRDVLTRQLMGSSYQLTVNSVDFLFENVYSEFDLADAQQLEKAPLSHFRFNCNIQLPEACPVPAIPIPTCYSLLFDGVMEYVNCTNNSAFDLEISDSFSFSAIIKNNGDYFPFVQKFNAINNVNFWGYRGFVGITKKITFDFIGGNSNFRIQVLSNDALLDNVWYNITVTYNGNGTASGLKFYLDGVELSTFVFKDNFTGTLINSEILTLGGQPTSFSPLYGNGNYAQARMWNIELSAAEVLTEYNNGLNPSTIQTGSLILNTDINNATFGTEWSIPDLTGITAGYTSANMEVEDKVEDCP